MFLHQKLYDLILFGFYFHGVSFESNSTKDIDIFQ